MPNVPLESEEAQTLVAWLRVRGLRFTHVPSETGSSPEMRRRAIRMKQQGTSPGVPDYLVLIPPERSVTGQGFALFVELKRVSGSRTSPDQREWIDALNALDVAPVAAYVALGAEDAIAIVSKHLAPRPHRSPSVDSLNRRGAA